MVAVVREKKPKEKISWSLLIFVSYSFIETCFYVGVEHQVLPCLFLHRNVAVLKKWLFFGDSVLDKPNQTRKKGNLPVSPATAESIA